MDVDNKSSDSEVKEAVPAYDKRYTYADFITWEGDECWELIDGVPYLMSTPTPFHQEVSGNLHFLIKSFLIGKPCKVYYSPFAVRLNAEKFDNTVPIHVLDGCEIDMIKVFEEKSI